MLAGGADRAFERLYRRHVGDVHRYASTVLTNAADAEDVTQTVFLNAYRAYSAGERPDQALNWLITITHNVCRQRFRDGARRPREVVLDEDLSIAPLEDGEERYRQEDIVRALEQLSLNQRAALVLRELEGRSYGEIASILKLSTSAIETLIFRARRAFREQLEGSLTCSEAERRSRYSSTEGWSGRSAGRFGRISLLSWVRLAGAAFPRAALGAARACRFSAAAVARGRLRRRGRGGRRHCARCEGSRVRDCGDRRSRRRHNRDRPACPREELAGARSASRPPRHTRGHTGARSACERGGAGDGDPRIRAIEPRSRQRPRARDTSRPRRRPRRRLRPQRPAATPIAAVTESSTAAPAHERVSATKPPPAGSRSRRAAVFLAISRRT